ncbi:hypothetical protein PFISCL1PPCAC_12919, partial [Pristionchus fissidentatus]
TTSLSCRGFSARRSSWSPRNRLRSTAQSWACSDRPTTRFRQQDSTSTTSSILQNFLLSKNISSETKNDCSATSSTTRINISEWASFSRHDTKIRAINASLLK